MAAGKVYLVGAGPGEAGLITQKGLECLARADVVVYDRLLDERLLDSAPPRAEKIYAGKTSSRHTMEQGEINRLLVEKAAPGRVVVRLKGGDPFVLGRGGEEAEALAASNIPFEVVPGISSAIAVPAYAGIPVTHRGVASSFAVVTGHEQPGKPDSSLNWAHLATGVDTLVFLMGMENLGEIAARLIEHGRSRETPVAVIKDGAGPGQKTVVATLSDIAAKIKENGLTAPAVIVVGEVVRLRESLRWFDNRPLFGKRVLVTRARHQVSALSRLLAERGAQPIELPAIDIQPMPDNVELTEALSNLKSYQWVLFTSANGVEAVFNVLRDLKRDARTFGGLKVGAIGPATAAALAAKGIIADYVPEKYTSDDILAGLKDHRMAGMLFLLLRAEIADDKLGTGLKALGAAVTEISVYRTIPDRQAMARARDLLASGKIDIITFTSSSTVSSLLSAFGGHIALNGARVACIGPRTAETAMKAGMKVDIMAKEHTIPGLVTAMEEYYVREGKDGGIS